MDFSKNRGDLSLKWGACTLKRVHGVVKGMPKRRISPQVLVRRRFPRHLFAVLQRRRHHHLAETGNNVTGDFTLTQTQSSSVSQDKTGNDQFNDPGSYYTNTQTETNDTTTTVTANSITGADTQTVNGLDTVSARETGGNDTIDAPAYTLTEIDVDTSGSNRTGNDITGSYTLAASSSVGTTFIESAVSDNGSYDLNKNLVTTEDSQEGGNSITGAYSLTVTTESTEIDNEGDEFSAGWDNFTNNKFDDVTQTQTGNHVTGVYSLNNSDIHSSSLAQTGADSAGTFSLTETTSGTSVGYETGNEITGIYTLTTQTTTDGYTATETANFNDVTFTLTETGNDTVTASATGNQVTGYLDQFDTVSDGYTMTETGTRTGGDFSEVVTGSETYQDQETGTPQQGNYSVYETGSGTFDRTDDGPGATLPSQFGTTGYTLTETYGDLRGGINQTTVSGADRYSLLEAWQDTSASGVSGGDGIGMAEHQPFGAPVVTVSWWKRAAGRRQRQPVGQQRRCAERHGLLLR